MAHDLVSKVFGVFFMQTETVIFFVAVPLFQFDDKVYRLGILDTLNTEQRFDIDDTDASKLDKMPRDVRRRSDQSDVTYFTKFYNIITYQTMPTLDQLQCSLTLADAALSCDQDPLTIDIYQNSVDGNTWCSQRMISAIRLEVVLSVTNVGTLYLIAMSIIS